MSRKSKLEESSFPEEGSQKSEVRGRKTEAGDQKTELQNEEERTSSSREPVTIPIEDSIDLHAFPPRETKAVLEEYLRLAHEKGFRTVRIIHGRGIGVQREIVRSVLSDHPLVVSFKDARPEAGGWGATWVVLIEQ